MKTSTTPRIATFDLLRGLFLCVIIIDHFGKFPGGFDLLTGRGLLWASAAEGFFFLSGLMVGLVRGKHAKQGNFKAAWKAIWKRTVVLYLWAVALTLFFTAWAHLVHYGAGVKGGYVEYSSNWDIFTDAISLHYVYGWTDYLAHYAVFMFWAPLALFLLQRFKWWVVPGVSLVFWFMRGDNFNLAWQILFFSGMTVGFYYQKILAWLNQLHFRRLLSWGIVTAAGVTYVASVAQFNELLSRLTLDQALWFDKNSLAPLRLAIFFLWFSALFLITCHFEAKLPPKMRVFFGSLGQHSLAAYIWSSTLIFGLDLALPATSYGFLLNALLDIGLIALVWVLAQTKPLRRLRLGRQALIPGARPHTLYNR